MKENKKIGKLLELLNEFYKEKGDIFRAIQHNDRLKVFELENDDSVRDVAIISKEYGFIKWLVENDKIDIKALVVKGEMRSGWDFDNKKGDEETGEESWNKYFSELCIMILAIQDEPIRFLCEIIK